MAKYRRSSRNKARRRAVDTLFEANLRGLDNNPQALEDLLQQRCQITTAQTTLPEYAQTIVAGVIAHLFEIDALIDDYTTDWALDRLPATDLAIMRCAVWEIKFNPDVPWKIAIDEAVGISRDIATNDSPAFINAVLDAVAHSAEDQKSLLKQQVNSPEISVDQPLIQPDGFAQEEDENPVLGNWDEDEIPLDFSQDQVPEDFSEEDAGQDSVLGNWGEDEIPLDFSQDQVPRDFPDDFPDDEPAGDGQSQRPDLEAQDPEAQDPDPLDSLSSPAADDGSAQTGQPEKADPDLDSSFPDRLDRNDNS